MKTLKLSKSNVLNAIADVMTKMDYSKVSIADLAYEIAKRLGFK